VTKNTIIAAVISLSSIAVIIDTTTDEISIME
jgi:hypothetical protein